MAQWAIWRCQNSDQWIPELTKPTKQMSVTILSPQHKVTVYLSFSRNLQKAKNPVQTFDYTLQRQKNQWDLLPSNMAAAALINDNLTEMNRLITFLKLDIPRD